MSSIYPRIVCATTLIIAASSAFALGPATPVPVPPPAVAALRGPATPVPVPPPAVAALRGPATPVPVPPPTFA